MHRGLILECRGKALTALVQQRDFWLPLWKEMNARLRAMYPETVEQNVNPSKELVAIYKLWKTLTSYW